MKTYAIILASGNGSRYKNKLPKQFVKIAGVQYLDPYSFTKMALPLDLKRVRNGEPKYMIRELFARKYPHIPIPKKIPMPRATTQWLKDYKVSRPEFIPDCTKI